MSYQLWVRPEAEADLSQAHGRYEAVKTDLGLAFVQAMNAILDRIQERPHQFPLVHRKIRRALTKRFPFAIFFIIDNDTVVILAVLHQASDPSRWQNR